MKPKIDWKLLDRYLKGEVTLHERYVVDQWLAQAGSEDIRLFFAELRDDPEMRQLQAEVWARLQRGDMPTIGTRRREIPHEGGRTLSHRGLGTFKAAAAVALVLGSSMALWQIGRVMGQRHAETVLGMVTAPAGRPPMPVSLLDGSQVILSPGSTLRYAASFGADRREVQLDGEAYFDVRHDASRPFIVRAGDLVAEDLGTEFVIRAYPGDRHGRVIVRKGRVGIGDTVVTPGRLGHLGVNGQAIVEPADTAVWFAWTRGQLNLDGVLLRDALPKLDRWYDFEFRLAEPWLATIKLVGDFPEQLSNDVPKQIATMLGLYITQKGRVVTFHSNPASPS